MWSAKITVNNKTDYTIHVHRINVGRVANIEPNETWQNTTSLESNNYTFLFFKNNEKLMAGFCAFGPKAGVSVDRGWIYEGGQIIKLIAESNNKTLVQDTNGGRQLLNFNEFENGGEINLTYEMNI